MKFKLDFEIVFCSISMLMNIKLSVYFFLSNQESTPYKLKYRIYLHNMFESFCVFTEDNLNTLYHVWNFKSKDTFLLFIFRV